MADWIAYGYLGPIDMGWELLPEVAAIAIRLDDNRDGVPEMPSSRSGFLKDFDTACNLARRVGWEGDFAQEPRVVWLPPADDQTWMHAFAWKQENNGGTFVVSPYPLPWLGDAMYVAREGEA
jgi:hypothetical protein